MRCALRRVDSYFLAVIVVNKQTKDKYDVMYSTIYIAKKVITV